MRLLRITTNYLAYLEQFYATRPSLKRASYGEQYRALMRDCYGWYDVWTHALRPLGYEVWEPVGNAEPMQKAWAREHDTEYSEETWLMDIVAAQVEHFSPEVVFVNDYSTYPAAFFRHLRERCPSVRLIVGWCGAPYHDGSVFNAYDLVLSNITSLVDHFRREGHWGEHMAHAFDPRVLGRINTEGSPRHDFVFIGSIVKGKGYHNDREQLLQHLIRETGLAIWSNVEVPSFKSRIRYCGKCLMYHVGQKGKMIPALRNLLGGLPRLGPHLTRDVAPRRPYVAPEVATCAQKPVFGRAMFQTLSDAKVALNSHIDLAANHASNMRLFEATGVGTCLLTEHQPDLERLFNPDEEVVTYRSSEEAIERVRYLLDHESERRRIAQAGQARTLRDHTFRQRAEQLDQLVRRGLARYGASGRNQCTVSS